MGRTVFIDTAVITNQLDALPQIEFLLSAFSVVNVQHLNVIISTISSMD